MDLVTSLKTMKKNSLAFKIWKYLILFSIIILVFLWLFQVVLLDRYYEFSKQEESKKIASFLAQEDLTSSEAEQIAYEQDICIELTNQYETIYQVGSCFLNTSHAKLKFLNEQKKESTYIYENERFNKKTLVFSKKLEDNHYLFISTSLEPLNKTASILASQLLYVTIAVFILSFVVAYFISKKISKPIEKLSTVSKEISKGNEKVCFQVDEDIQELDALANSLNEMRMELEKTEELRRDLMANVSHDLKTPLTLIKAYAEMVRDLHYKNKKKREQSLNTIIQETDRLTVLVNDILALSKEEANVEILNIEKVDCIQMIEDVLMRYTILKEEGYQFLFEHPEKAIIKADKKKLEQVIYNLVNNAINYTGNDKKITIRLLELENAFHIEIMDTGKGIKKEDLPHIWDKYYQTNKNHQRNIYGTGLGLSIVKNILEHHHFNYGVQSKKNKGSCFYFDIPK